MTTEHQAVRAWQKSPTGNSLHTDQRETQRPFADSILAR